VTEPGSPRRPRPPQGGRPDLHHQFEAGRNELEAQLRDARKQFGEAQARINARTGRNLLFAILFGVILAGAMFVSLLIFKQLFIVLSAFLLAFAAFELAGALRYAGRDVPRIPTVAAAILACPVAYFVQGGQAWAIVGAVLLVTLWRLVELVNPATRVPPVELAKDLGAGAFVQLYITLLGTCGVALVARPGGEWWALSFLIVVVLIDIGAYASGLAFGRHPMAPRISPKKTWEGFAGAAATALLASVLLSVFVLQQPWWFGLIFGAVLLGTGTIGDLAESLIKRDLGIKDISSWLPGHGGFLDRLDSILPSAAAAYALYLLFA
jgi:phosphatidate cytidylyltransferase